MSPCVSRAAELYLAAFPKHDALTPLTLQSALFVKNLSYNVTPEELFELFGKFGPVRYVVRRTALAQHDPVDLLVCIYSQIRQGIANNTKGTAFVVYEDVMDAKQACDKLNGFNFQNRYLVGASSTYLSTIRYHHVSLYS